MFRSTHKTGPGLKKTLTALGLATTGLLLGGVVPTVHASSTNLSMNSINPTSNGGITLGTDAMTIFRNMVTLVIIVAALITLGYLIMGAIGWITSGGDKGKVEEARNKITAAVIGLLILASTWAVFQLVLQIALGSDSSGLSFVQLNANNVGTGAGNTNDDDDDDTEASVTCYNGAIKDDGTCGGNIITCDTTNQSSIKCKCVRVKSGSTYSTTCQ